MTAKEPKTIVLTGIKPTGRPHLGNYLGMIEPSLVLAQTHRALFFIADYHALTTIRDPRQLARLVRELAATWLALGLDPQQVIFYRQSAITEIFELMWVLSCETSKGLLNRAHAYKAAVENNRRASQDEDAGIRMGLFNYPLLMAADILVFGADKVPVGVDQQQHVEIARDIAAAFNQVYGQVFTLPSALVNATAVTVTGLDGRKMSKSYGNEIPVLASPEEMHDRVARIVTDSRSTEAPKEPDQCNLFNLYRLFAQQGDIERVRHLYRHGGLSYKSLKEALSTLIVQRFAHARTRYSRLMDNHGQIDRVLVEGAARARAVARETLRRVRKAVGIDA